MLKFLLPVPKNMTSFTGVTKLRQILYQSRVGFYPRMRGILIKEERYLERTPSEDKGRDWSCAATTKEHKILQVSLQQRQGRMPLQISEAVQTC